MLDTYFDADARSLALEVLTEHEQDIRSGEIVTDVTADDVAAIAAELHAKIDQYGGTRPQMERTDLDLIGELLADLAKAVAAGEVVRSDGWTAAEIMIAANFLRY